MDLSYNLLRLSTRGYKFLADRVDLLPRSVVFEASKLCNLKCIGCPRNVEGNLSKQSGDKHLTLETVRRVVDKLPVKLVGFGGDGEPLLNPNLIDILEYLSKKKIHSSIITNGTIMTNQLAEDFRKLRVYELSFSYWGTSPETHEPLRVGADFDKLVRNHRIASSKVRTAIWYLITRRTIQDLTNLEDLIYKTNSSGIVFLKPVIKSLDTPTDFYPPDWEAYRIVLESTLSNIREKGLEIYNPLNLTPKVLRCYNPVHPVITIKGDVVPCWMTWGQGESEYYQGGHLRNNENNYLLGNIYKNSFKEIWNSPGHRELRQTVKYLNKEDGKSTPRDELVKLRETPLKERFDYCKVYQWRWGEAYN